ncbi:hypothetical protein EDB92DRAFT_1833147 [Lactarius akahatsu]|uniref:Uncharacterized protein n=1 Tax=Lactarius akahatsu TaxID=416441 RepID=A0AAD4QEM9_9AGAM|nr:hypothetical protein EDB92DRAFT_1833147 [Lactarius akahatsu]
MAPSVRVRRRHAYASIRDESRYASDQSERGRRALSEGASALSPSAPSESMPLPRESVPSSTPHDTNLLVPGHVPSRGDASRVNRHVRSSSFSYRSFSTDPDSNISNSPPATISRLSNFPPPQETIYEGTNAEVVVPGPRGHAKASRVQSALSSSPSRAGPDSDSDSDLDSEDEDRALEDDEHHHDDDVVDHLDVIDPQVATVATLTNTANAILLPPFSFYSRKPVVVLPRSARDQDLEGASVHTASTDELDRHVHDVLKRKQKFRRVMKGVWAFLQTLFAFGIYGFLVVFWGSAIVFFLAKWIVPGNTTTRDFWVEVCEQIENGGGYFVSRALAFIPWRIIDTYRIVKIWYFKRRTRNLRRKAGLPDLYDKDDLPDPMFDPNYVHVLTDKQQYELHHEQKKFMKSQTWYRPHGTETHRAIDLYRHSTALWICLLNDGNSVFQCMLAGCMWSMNRFDRPAWTTGLLIPLALGCGIASGVLIWRGGKKTKRTERVEERLRRVLQMDESQQAIGTDGMMAKLQGEKPVEHPANGVGTQDSSIRTPGIKIEEEMIIPPRG